MPNHHYHHHHHHIMGYYDEKNRNNTLIRSNQPISYKSSELTNSNLEDSGNLNNKLSINSSLLSDTLKELNHQRVSLILEINTLLLQKCIELQNTKNTEKDNLEVSESIMSGCIQRLQTNLAYLATIADKSYKNIVKSPVSSHSLKNSSNFCPTKQSKTGNLSNFKPNINTFSIEYKNDNINIYNQPQQIQNLPIMTIQQPPTQLIQGTDTHLQHIPLPFQKHNFLN
ncbi:hypothetical protein PCANB_002088 [Pneumocystis canis]|nr:hypothetical protein PCK1_001807 [Pneumocystis canis]KAG5439513.1 hypothetical protein PCANB_002088 [Pneumocystis canis]